LLAQSCSERALGFAHQLRYGSPQDAGFGSVGRHHADDGVRDLLGPPGLQERPQWIWFAGLAVLAEIGGLVMLSAVQAHRLAWHV